MILDGIFASQALDSSSEILEIEGADISTLVTEGVVNVEHRGDSTPGYSPNDVIGKIIYVKKIFSEDDCENERQRFYWDTIKLPYIYGIARLADEAGHPGAVAAAAFIRDQIANGEQPTWRWSIEGATLKKEGNRLVATACRRVALTLKPCNRSAISGVLEDKVVNTKIPKKIKTAIEAALEEENDAKKKELPLGLQRLGGNVDTPYLNIHDLEKMSAGMAVGAPGTLTGGSALQREHLISSDKVRSVIRSWDRKKPIRQHLKSELPDADDDFIEKLATLADEAELPKSAIKKSEPDLVAMFRKLQACTVELKKAALHGVGGIKAQGTESAGFPNEVKFQGKRVVPGHAVVHGSDSGESSNYALIGHDANHFYAVPHSAGPKWGPFDVVKLPKHDEKVGYSIIKPLQQLDQPHTLHAMQHGNFALNRTPEQHALIHGTDLSSPSLAAPKGAVTTSFTADSNHWRKMANGSTAYVKRQTAQSDFSDAAREAAYHNLAREFFGLGAHVPRVAVFNHPINGQEHAVIEKTPGEHVELNSRGQIRSHHAKVLNRLNDNGTLDRMGIMNMVLGNHDRHHQNYMIDPKSDAGVKLIDHGFSFEETPDSRIMMPPAYYTHHEMANKLGASLHKTPLHPEAVNWASQLQPEDLEAKMQSQGIPQRFIDAAKYRLGNLQARLKENPQMSRREMLDSPSLPAGFKVNYDEMPSDVPTETHTPSADADDWSNL